MKILSVEKGKYGFWGYAQRDDGVYINFDVKGNTVKTHEYPNRFKNYTHFMNVIWKFSGDYVWFTDKPIIVDELTKKSIENAYAIFVERDWNGNPSPWKE